MLGTILFLAAFGHLSSFACTIIDLCCGTALMDVHSLHVGAMVGFLAMGIVAGVGGVIFWYSPKEQP